MSNLKFLSLLKNDCTKIGTSEIAELASLYPNILDTIRLIWVHSPFYNSNELITTLLQKVTDRFLW
jgi:dynein heavy chain